MVSEMEMMKNMMRMTENRRASFLVTRRVPWVRVDRLLVRSGKAGENTSAAKPLKRHKVEHCHLLPNTKVPISTITLIIQKTARAKVIPCAPHSSICRWVKSAEGTIDCNGTFDQGSGIP